MPPVTFSHSLTIDGVPFKAARGDGRQSGPIASYVPLVRGGQPTAQMDPIEERTWHRGSGASRSVGIPGMHGHGKNVWTGDPGYVTTGPLVSTLALASADADVPAQGFAEYDGTLYVLSGRYVNRITGASMTAIALEQDLGVGFVATGIRPFKTSLYVGGTGGNIWERPSSGVWTNTMVAAAVARGRMASVHWTLGAVSAERLVAEHSTTSISYVADDPRDSADWGAEIPIGPHAITNLVGAYDHVYIATTGGLRDLDSTGQAPNLTPEVALMVMATNGRATLAAGGYVYMGAGYGLLRVLVAGDQAYARTEWCSPMLRLPSEAPVAGLPMALAKHGEWLILAQYDSAADVSYVSWGREAREDEPGPLVWHCSPIVLEGLQVTALHVSGLVSQSPRLWMAVTDGVTPSLRYATLPLETPLQDLRNNRPYRFATSGELYPTAIESDDAEPLDLVDVLAEADSLGSGTSVAVAVAVDGSSAYTSVGTLTASRAPLTPTTNVRGVRLAPKLTLAGTTTAPPVVRRLSWRPIRRPDMREVRRYLLEIGPNVRHAGGNVDGVDARRRKATLARLQTGARVTVRDEYGQSLTALVLAPVQLQEVQAAGDNSHEPVLVAPLEIAVLATAGSGAYWDGGGAWDGGAVWS